MNAKELKKIKDHTEVFKLNPKSKVTYTLQNKLDGADKGYCYITAQKSGKTLLMFLGIMVWV